MIHFHEIKLRWKLGVAAVPNSTFTLIMSDSSKSTFDLIYSHLAWLHEMVKGLLVF